MYYKILLNNGKTKNFTTQKYKTLKSAEEQVAFILKLQNTELTTQIIKFTRQRGFKIQELKDTFLYNKNKTVKALTIGKIQAGYILRDLDRYKALADERLLIISNILTELRDFKRDNPNIILTELENKILNILNKT